MNRSNLYGSVLRRRLDENAGPTAREFGIGHDPEIAAMLIVSAICIDAKFARVSTPVAQDLMAFVQAPADATSAREPAAI